MIPKTIHYCWFGGKQLPRAAVKFIKSWQRKLPDYEIIQWNENNFPVDQYPFAKEALLEKKYAFVSDVCRLYVLKEFGGIYMDTDVEIIKTLDAFLTSTAFSGFESDALVQSAIMGSVKNGQWVTELLDYYNDRSFYKENCSFDETPNTTIITQLMKEKGFIMNNTFQKIENYVAFYPTDFFCPKSYQTGRMNITKNTHCIHHFSGSWKPFGERILHFQKWRIRKLVGYKNVSLIRIFLESLRRKELDKK